MSHYCTINVSKLCIRLLSNGFKQGIRLNLKRQFQFHLLKTKQYQLEGRGHAGNTTYTADSNTNSTKPRQKNNMNVNGYKNTEDTQKQTTGKDGSTALERSVTNVTGGLKPGL